MNKYIMIGLFCLTCLLVGCISTDDLKRYQKSISGPAVSYGAWRPTPEPGEGTATSAAVTGSGIHSANNVTEEMQSAQFWIGKTMASDRILLSEKEIFDFNDKMMQQLSVQEEAGYYNLDSYNSAVDKDTLMKMINRTDFSEKTCYRGEELAGDALLSSYRKNCNMDFLADLNTVKYGIVCSRADVRELPTKDVLSEKRGDVLTDILQNTALPVNEPVLVLHRSLDGKWYYILSNEYSGWVEESHIGLCSSREEWVKIREQKDFLVVTGDKVYLEPNPVNARTDRFELTMGTRVLIALEEEYKGIVDGRNVVDNYVVKIPVREQDGSLSWEIAMVPVGKEVSRGYLEYTRANVLKLSFSLLGNYYGWGGAFGSRDCSSMVKDIYACFGFRLPRNSSAQALIPSEGRMDLSKLSVKEKKQRLNSLEAGTLLQMPGHVMIYLGCVDRHYYVISANGQFSDVGEKAGEGDCSTRTVTVNDLEVKSPADGKSWLEKLAVLIPL